MKPLITVALFTLKEMAKRKSFIISNIVIILLIVVGFNIPNIMEKFSGGTAFEDKTIAILDNQNVFEGTLAQLNTIPNTGYKFEIEANNITKENIISKIDAGEIEAAILVNNSTNNDKVEIEYLTENITTIGAFPETLISALNTIYTNLQISKLDLSQEELHSLTPNFDFKLAQTSDKEVSGNVFVTMMLSILLFYAIYFCAYQVSASITTEKTSKIIETLVTSTTPRTIVIGKTIGVGLLGLLQVIVIAGIAFLSANAFLDKDLVSSAIDLSKFTPLLAIITIVYFILGYSLYSLFYALTGSTISKPEDIQSANGPVAILAVIGFYLSYFSMMNPTGDINLFAAIFPLSSPFSMPFRVMMGIATPTEIFASIAVLIIVIILLAKISIKIYSQAILNYGTRPNLKSIINMYKAK